MPIIAIMAASSSLVASMASPSLPDIHDDDIIDISALGPDASWVAPDGVTPIVGDATLGRRSEFKPVAIMRSATRVGEAVQEFARVLGYGEAFSFLIT